MEGFEKPPAQSLRNRMLTSPRFNVQYAQDLYAQQPVHNSPGVWK